MKKIKQFSLKAMLLTILAALTIGFTGCSDELSGDQTQGKPGYLTINVKTLQPKQTKLAGDSINDYKLIKDLNIFLFDTSGNKLQQKYVSGGYTSNTSISMQVGTIPPGSKVVVVANYGNAITGVTIYADLTGKEITTVKDFATDGLHMTGEANVSGIGTGTYESHVNVAPVESKITVNWTLTDVATNYVVTGVYVVNAINKTTLPIIRQRTYVSDWTAAASDIAISSKINAGIRTASFGLTPVTGRDYDFYTGMTDLSATTDTYLKDKISDTAFTTDASGTYVKYNTSMIATGLHYYVGENYHADLPLANGGDSITNASANANTIVVVRVTPKSDAPAYIKKGGHKYYTYDFRNTSSGLNAAATVTNITEGFSVRRKTNYNLTFALTSIGANDPFVRNTLTVYVTAEGWNDGGVTAGF